MYLMITMPTHLICCKQTLFCAAVLDLISIFIQPNFQPILHGKRVCKIKKYVYLFYIIFRTGKHNVLNFTYPVDPGILAENLDE